MLCKMHYYCPHHHWHRRASYRTENVACLIGTNYRSANKGERSILLPVGLIVCDHHGMSLVYEWAASIAFSFCMTIHSISMMV